MARDPLSRYRKYPQDVTSNESIHVLNPSWVFWDLQKVNSISVRTTLTRKRVRKRVLMSSVYMVSHCVRDIQPDLAQWLSRVNIFPLV
jgi:hypothetical protein